MSKGYWIMLFILAVLAVCLMSVPMFISAYSEYEQMCPPGNTIVECNN